MGKGQNEGGFSEDQLQMYKDCFKLMDINKDGQLDKNDLRGAFDNVGVLMSEGELDGLLGENHDDTLGLCTWLRTLLDDKYVKVVNAFDVVTGADFGDQLRIQEPSEVDLGVGVTVVKNHGEEFSGWLQRGFLVHLEADGAAVGEIASGGVELADGAHQLVWIIFELLLQHNPEPRRSVLLLHALQITQELVCFISSLPSIGGPALVYSNFFSQHSDHLVDGIVPEVSRQLGGIGSDQLPLLAQVLVVDIPGLAVLQPESPADLPLCLLHCALLCSELEFFSEVHLLNAWLSGDIMSADILYELLVRDGLDLDVWPRVNSDQHLNKVDIGLAAGEHVLACVSRPSIVHVSQNFSSEAAILHPGHDKSRLPGSSLSFFVRDHLGQIRQSTLGRLLSWPG